VLTIVYLVVSISADKTAKAPQKLSQSSALPIITDELLVNAAFERQLSSSNSGDRGINQVQKNEKRETCVTKLEVDFATYIQQVDEHLTLLSKSRFPHNQLDYLLFNNSTDDEERLRRLLSFHQQYGIEPVVAHEVLRLCLKVNDGSCTTELINELASVDEQNGATWFYVASYFVQQKDEENTLHAIDALTKTTVFNGRSGERAMRYVNALEGSTVNQFANNAFIGLGKGTNILSGLLNLHDWCKTSGGKMHVENACLALGQNIASFQQYALARRLGFELQRFIYQARENHEMVDLINQKDQLENRSNMKEIINNQEYLDTILLADESLLREYLQNIDQYGDLKAQAIVFEDYQFQTGKEQSTVCRSEQAAL